MLSLFAAIINKLSGKMETEVPRIFEAVFECTLQMITRNFEVGDRCNLGHIWGYTRSAIWGSQLSELCKCWLV